MPGLRSLPTFRPEIVISRLQWSLKKACLDFCLFLSFPFFFFKYKQSFSRVLCYLTNDRNLQQPCEVLAMNCFSFFNSLGQWSRDFSVPRFGVSPTFKLYCPTEHPTVFVGEMETIKIHLVLSLQRNTQAFILLTSPSHGIQDSGFSGGQRTNKWW